MFLRGRPAHEVDLDEQVLVAWVGAPQRQWLVRCAAPASQHLPGVGDAVAVGVTGVDRPGAVELRAPTVPDRDEHVPRACSRSVPSPSPSGSWPEISASLRTSRSRPVTDNCVRGTATTTHREPSTAGERYAAAPAVPFP